MIYRIHRWLAVVVAAATLGWFVSGALMMLPDRWLTLSPEVIVGPGGQLRQIGAPPFSAAAVSPRTAIATVQHATGDSTPVLDVSMRRVAGRLAYEIRTERGGHLVDAIDGTIVVVTEAFAKDAVSRMFDRPVDFGPIARVSSPSQAYGGPLPAYRIPLNDGKGTVVYVDGSTAQIRLTDRLTRAAATIMGLHTFAFLRSTLPAIVVRAMMLAMAGVGTAMALTGIAILFVQLARWLRRRSRAAEAMKSRTSNRLAAR
jgi:hypothetical protein